MAMSGDVARGRGNDSGGTIIQWSVVICGDNQMQRLDSASAVLLKLRNVLVRY